MGLSNFYSCQLMVFFELQIQSIVLETSTLVLLILFTVAKGMRYSFINQFLLCFDQTFFFKYITS
ncbi:MAG: hypothetical protein RLZZ358_2522 [Bacteroidota bacterium]